MVGLTENKGTQPSLAGAWAKLGNYLGAMLRAVVVKGVILRHMYDNN